MATADMATSGMATHEMRKALEAEGVALPGEETLKELSREYNEHLERERKLKNKEGFSMRIRLTVQHAPSTIWSTQILNLYC